MPRPSRPLARDRRRFLKLAGFATLTSAVGSTLFSFAQGATVASSPKAAGAAPDSSKTAKPPEISEDARALASIVKRRYGQHLTAEQLEAVTRELENRIGTGKDLRKAKLANADEPDFTFRP